MRKADQHVYKKRQPRVVAVQYDSFSGHSFLRECREVFPELATADWQITSSTRNAPETVHIELPSWKDTFRPTDWLVQGCDGITPGKLTKVSNNEFRTNWEKE